MTFQNAFMDELAKESDATTSAALAKHRARSASGAAERGRARILGGKMRKSSFIDIDPVTGREVEEISTGLMSKNSEFYVFLSKLAKEQRAHIQSIKHLRPIGGPAMGDTLKSLGAKLKQRETTASFK